VIKHAKRLFIRSLNAKGRPKPGARGARSPDGGLAKRMLAAGSRPPACPRSQPASTRWLADERRMRNVWMAAGRFVGARGIGTWEFLVLK
jgi:hypothetical protein